MREKNLENGNEIGKEKAMRKWNEKMVIGKVEEEVMEKTKEEQKQDVKMTFNTKSMAKNGRENRTLSALMQPPSEPLSRMNKE